MGAQSALNGLVGTIGVGLSSVARNAKGKGGGGKGEGELGYFAKKEADTMLGNNLFSRINSAMDGEKNLEMADKSRENRDKAIQARALQREVLRKRQQQVKAVITGVNKDLKTRMSIRED